MDSYRPGRTIDVVPREDWAFLEQLRLYFETGRHFFVHANYFPNRPIDQQDTQTMLWMPLEGRDVPGRHYSGKTAIVGHSCRRDGRILDLGHVKCIDTGCGHGGLLTALDVTSGRVWQVTEDGEPKVP